MYEKIKRFIKGLMKKVVIADKFSMELLGDMELGSKIELDVFDCGVKHPTNRRLCSYIETDKRKIYLSKGIEPIWYSSAKDLEKQLTIVSRETFTIAKQLEEAGFQISIFGMDIKTAEKLLVDSELQFKIAI